MRKYSLPLTSGLILAAVLSGCATMDTGNASAKTEATGSAGGANSQGANAKLAHCDATLGTIAVVEDTTASWYVSLSQYHLGPTTPVLKLMIQQSNCFVVVDCGRAMNNMMQERALQQSGELRSNSNFGKGQMVSADFTLTPSITFSNQNAGGAGAAVGGLFGSIGATVGDNRSSVQLAAAEGSAKNWDFGAAGGMLGAGFGAVGGGYSNTAEGKVIVAAFMDSYNGVVAAVKNYKAQSVQDGLGTGGHLAVQGGATPTRMTPMQAQERLNQLGYPVGTPDGVLGSHSITQIKAFQKAKGIPVTGELDDATVNALGG